jgi:glycosyltransferase involved in cell wall biosynthesis
MPKISVIIPVYNVEKYIITCINSLLHQTLDDLEVIVVDDHGQDNSISLLKAHIENHERKNMFRFAETIVNSGPGIARNVGLQIAQGEYVAFLDGDDWIEPAMYKELYNVATQETTDICYCYVQQEDIKEKPIRILQNPQIQQGAFTQQDKRHFLVNYAAYCWLYIYRRDFLLTNNIVFPLEKNAEDSYFVACCVLCAERIASVNKPLYHYRQIKNSLSQRKDDKRYIEKLSVFNRLLQFAKTKGLYDDFYNELNFIYLKKAFIMATLNYLNNAAKPQVKTLKEIYQLLITNVPDYKRNKYYKNSFKIRSIVIFLKKMPRLAVVVLSRIIVR